VQNWSVGRLWSWAHRGSNTGSMMLHFGTLQWDIPLFCRIKVRHRRVWHLLKVFTGISTLNRKLASYREEAVERSRGKYQAQTSMLLTLLSQTEERPDLELCLSPDLLRSFWLLCDPRSDAPLLIRCSAEQDCPSQWTVLASWGDARVQAVLWNLLQK